MSIDIENSFEEIQHSFMIKSLNEVGIKGTYLNILMAKKKRKKHLQSIGSSSHNNQTRKRNKKEDGLGRVVGGRGWGPYVHLWWVHVNVWQNHYNIVISFQLK